MLPIDELTGLLSRVEFLARLQAALALASQNQQTLALAYFDLDHLLRVNNRYGHLAGDMVIQAAGRALNMAFTGASFVGRLAGDEFAAAMPGHDLDTAREVVEKVIATIEHNGVPFDVEDKPITLQVTISAGIALYPRDGVNVDDLQRKAYDAAMRAKEAGGNLCRVFEEIEEKDALTGVLIRESLHRQADLLIEQAGRERTSLAVISMDIDEFDAINKQYGHFTGDEVLRQVGMMLAKNFKEPGLVGRVGGDQFVVLLPRTRSETAFILAEEVRKVIEDNPINLQIGHISTRLSIKISGGVAEYPQDASERVDLLRKADEALYRAKRQGRNRICLPSSTQMVTKTSHYTQTQLEMLAAQAKKLGKSEAFLLREALDDLLRKYETGRAE
ncbi:MAG TPA: GGDEF domain-containing protein [Anaerolineaceae bacterium]